MAKVQPPQIRTANRLKTGDVVYWRHASWVEDLSAAEIFCDEPTGERALGHARQFVADCVMVNPYLFAVEIGDSGVRPLEEREIIRAAGPTVRADTGKQAAPHV